MWIGECRCTKKSVRTVKQRIRCGTAAMMAAVLFAQFPQPLAAAGKENNTEQTGRAEVRIEDKTQRYLMLEECPAGRQEDYIALAVPDGDSYEVKQGDTLWGIARQSYGTGSAWERIKAANPDTVGENALILTGAELQIPSIYYLERQADSRGGFSAPACSYDMPADWAYAYADWEVCLESIYPRENPESQVCVHITENRMFPDGVGENWEDMQTQIKESAEKVQGVSFSDFQFERYFREDGRELIFYCFVCETEEEEIQFAAAYVPGKKYLAEFIGYCPLEKEGEETSAAYAIGEITRYMAASFTETEEEKSWASLKYRPYLGFEDWAYEDLHNPFAIAAERYAKEEAVYNGEEKEIVFVSEEWEDFIRIATSYHYDMTDEEWEEFSQRPLCTSDVAWITEVALMESPIPGRDTVSVNNLSPRDADCTKYNLTTLKDLAVLPNLEKIELEIGGVSDYEILGECPSLREITIVSEEPLTETDWLAELPQLESLTLGISMFGYLIEMGFEIEGGSTFTGKGNAAGEDGAEKEKQQEEGTEESSGKSLEEVLGECTGLQYLDVESADMTDFSFLEKLPNLYAFRLAAPDYGSGEPEDRSSLFGENDYPQIKCLVVDDKWLRNQE